MSQESVGKTLIVEIRTVEDEVFSPSQTKPLEVYRDRANNYYLATEMDKIKKAILDAIPRLGSNYRHLLLFNVQVVPGDENDAFIASVKPKSKRRKRRGSRN